MSTLDGPREAGELRPPPEVLALLSQLRAREGVESAADLDIDTVRDVERAAGLRFEDDLLAVFAATVPSIEQGLNMRLSMVVGHCGALREVGAPGNLIGVGREDDGRYLCVAMKRRDGSCTEILTYEPSKRTATSETLQQFLERHRDRTPRGTSSCAGQPLQPRLLDRPLESQKGVRVMHAKFGEGVVITETGSGPNRKVKVDFPGTGLKLLQARFLTWL